MLHVRLIHIHIISKSLIRNVIFILVFVDMISFIFIFGRVLTPPIGCVFLPLAASRRLTRATADGAEECLNCTLGHPGFAYV